MPGLRARFPTPVFAVLLCAVSLAAPSPAQGDDLLPVAPAQLDAAYWIAKLPDAENVVLDADAIAVRNAALPTLEPSWHDLAALPALDREAMRAWIERISAAPARALYAD